MIGNEFDVKFGELGRVLEAIFSTSEARDYLVARAFQPSKDTTTPEPPAKRGNRARYRMAGGVGTVAQKLPPTASTAAAVSAKPSGHVLHGVASVAAPSSLDRPMLRSAPSVQPAPPSFPSPIFNPGQTAGAFVSLHQLALLKECMSCKDFDMVNKTFDDLLRGVLGLAG